MKTTYIIRFSFAAVILTFVACGPQNKMHTLKPANIFLANSDTLKAKNVQDIKAFVAQKGNDDANVVGAPAPKSVTNAQSLAARINSIVVDDKESTLGVVMIDADQKQYQVTFSDPQPTQLNHVILFNKVTTHQVNNGLVNPAPVPSKLIAEMKLDKSESGLIIVSISSSSLDSTGNRPSADFLIRTNKLVISKSDNKNDIAKQMASMNLYVRVTQAFYGDDSTIDTGKLPQILSSPANQLKIQGISNGKLITLVSSIQSQATIDGGTVLAQINDGDKSDNGLASELGAAQVTIQMDSAPLTAATFNMSIATSSNTANIILTLGTSTIPKMFSKIQEKANNNLELIPTTQATPAPAPAPSIPVATATTTTINSSTPASASAAQLAIVPAATSSPAAVDSSSKNQNTDEVRQLSLPDVPEFDSNSNPLTDLESNLQYVKPEVDQQNTNDRPLVLLPSSVDRVK